MKSKYIFKSNPPAIKDAEIKQIMDFDKLLNQHNLEQVPPKRFSTGQLVKGIKPYVFTVLVAALTTVITYYIVQKNDSKPEARESTEVQEPKTVSSQPIVNPVVPEAIFQETKPNSTSVNKTQKPKNVNREQPKTEAIVPMVAETQEVLSGSIAKAKYLEASPAVGYDSLYSYFSKTLRYPTEHIEAGIEGVVMVQCTIDKNGKVKNLEITQSLGELFDQEALRVIQSMPTWAPASINGKNTTSKISIPLTFKVLKSENK